MSSIDPTRRQYATGPAVSRCVTGPEANSGRVARAPSRCPIFARHIAYGWRRVTGMANSGPDRVPAPTGSWLPAFVAVALIWGTSFMFIKIAVADVPPAYLALGRIAMGALTLLIMLVLGRQRLPRGR